jgi:hypothetical protein
LDLWTYVDSGVEEKSNTCIAEDQTCLSQNNKPKPPLYSRWARVESCSGIPVRLVGADLKYDNCTILLPISSRNRGLGHEASSSGPLKAKLVIRQSDNENDNNNMNNIQKKNSGHGHILAETFFELTDMASQWNRTVGESVSVPHYKYGGQRLVLRLVDESRGYSTLERGDGITLRRHTGSCHRGDHSSSSQNRNANNNNNPFCYQPIIYVDDMALRSTSWIEMAPPAYHNEKKPVTLRLKISFISPLRDTLIRQVVYPMQMAESILHKSELDEIKYLISDEHLYRFALTQMISFVHVWVDVMAFKDEVRFYVGRTDMGGLSISSVLWRFICSLVIFLYLWDTGSTSWLVLSSVGMGVATDGWKSWKMLKPTFILRPPFVRLRDPAKLSPMEGSAAELDRIARTYLGLMFYPLLLGSALYARRTYVYKSLWSWLISNAANAVYTFGFIALCPQLYINYRLKSVAHLPWKVFLYKMFNTFIDDVFAFLIEMPLKHKIMTLRDDVVFLGFLYQAYIYRVDKSRRNEFGYAYDDDQNKEEHDGIDNTEVNNGHAHGIDNTEVNNGHAHAKNQDAVVPE